MGRDAKVTLFQSVVSCGRYAHAAYTYQSTGSSPVSGHITSFAQCHAGRACALSGTCVNAGIKCLLRENVDTHLMLEWGRGIYA